MIKYHNLTKEEGPVESTRDPKGMQDIGPYHEHSGRPRDGVKIKAGDIDRLRDFNLKKNKTTVTTATYKAKQTDAVIWVERTATGVCTITLPLISSYVLENEVVELLIIDADGNASVNNITITPAAGNTVSSGTISTNYGYKRLIGSKTKWIAC